MAAGGFYNLRNGIGIRSWGDANIVAETPNYKRNYKISVDQSISIDSVDLCTKVA